MCPYYLETASRARPLWVYQWSPDSVVLVVVEKVRDRPDLHFSVLLATIGRFATMVMSQRKKETHPNPPSFLAVTSATDVFLFFFF